MRAIIYSDLQETEFKYQAEKFIFHFSSMFYLNKFKEEIDDFRDKIRRKFTTLYLIPVELNDYAAIILYSKIEKRGFYIVSRETKGVINWLGNITLNGVIKTNAN